MAKNDSGANLGFEAQLWEMADKMRGHMDASEYKHVVLGLLFPKYMSDAFSAKCDDLAARRDTDYTNPGYRVEKVSCSGGMFTTQVSSCATVPRRENSVKYELPRSRENTDAVKVR